MTLQSLEQEVRQVEIIGVCCYLLPASALLARVGQSLQGGETWSAVWPWIPSCSQTMCPNISVGPLLGAV